MKERRKVLPDVSCLPKICFIPISSRKLFTVNGRRGGEERESWRWTVCYCWIRMFFSVFFPV